LKEKGRKWNSDTEIQELVQAINADDGSTDAFKGEYSPEKAQALKSAEFDRIALGKRGLPYERLDQLTIEVLLGVR
jgi:xylose isomerase